MAGRPYVAHAGQLQSGDERAISVVTSTGYDNMEPVPGEVDVDMDDRTGEGRNIHA